MLNNYSKPQDKKWALIESKNYPNKFYYYHTLGKQVLWKDDVENILAERENGNAATRPCENSLHAMGAATAYIPIVFQNCMITPHNAVGCALPCSHTGPFNHTISHSNFHPTGIPCNPKSPQCNGNGVAGAKNGFENSRNNFGNEKLVPESPELPHYNNFPRRENVIEKYGNNLVSNYRETSPKSPEMPQCNEYDKTNATKPKNLASNFQNSTDFGNREANSKFPDLSAALPNFFANSFTNSQKHDQIETPFNASLSNTALHNTSPDTNIINISSDMNTDNNTEWDPTITNTNLERKNFGKWKNLAANDLRHILKSKRSLNSQAKSVAGHVVDKPRKHINLNTTTSPNPPDFFLAIFDLKKLARFGIGQKWYIVIDVEVVMYDGDFILNFISEDTTCSILIPYAVSLAIRSQCIRQNENDILEKARGVYKKFIKNPPSNVEVQNCHDDEIESMSLNDCILKCCQYVTSQNIHAVLVTTDKSLFIRANSQNIHCYMLESIKQNSNTLTRKDTILKNNNNKTPLVDKNNNNKTPLVDRNNNNKTYLVDKNNNKTLNCKNQKGPLKDVTEKSNKEIVFTIDAINKKSLDKINMDIVREIKKYKLDNSKALHTLRLRREEFICTFVQLMEDALSDALLSLKCANYDLSPPWSLKEALCVLKKWNVDSGKVAYIIEIFLQSMDEKTGALDYNMKAEDIVSMVGCGAILIRLLKEKLPDNEVLSDSEQALVNMLLTIGGEVQNVINSNPERPFCENIQNSENGGANCTDKEIKKHRLASTVHRVDNKCVENKTKDKDVLNPSTVLPGNKDINISSGYETNADLSNGSANNTVRTRIANKNIERTSHLGRNDKIHAEKAKNKKDITRSIFDIEPKSTAEKPAKENGLVNKTIPESCVQVPKTGNQCLKTLKVSFKNDRFRSTTNVDQYDINENDIRTLNNNFDNEEYVVADRAENRSVGNNDITNLDRTSEKSKLNAFLKYFLRKTINSFEIIHNSLIKMNNGVKDMEKEAYLNKFIETRSHLLAIIDRLKRILKQDSFGDSQINEDPIPPEEGLDLVTDRAKYKKIIAKALVTARALEKAVRKTIDQLYMCLVK